MDQPNARDGNAGGVRTGGAVRVHRFEVRSAAGVADPRADAVRRAASRAGLDVSRVRTANVYLVEGELDDRAVAAIRDRLLVDPVTTRGTLGALPPAAGDVVVEVHPLPGVMDPAAQSVRDAIRDLAGAVTQVSTARRYDFAGVPAEAALRFARGALANPVVHAIHAAPFHPPRLPRGEPVGFRRRTVALRDLDDEGLTGLSRLGHLFLSLDEMRAVQAEFRRLGRDPTDAELETIAQTWSEHCVHKTMKSRIVYREAEGEIPAEWARRPGHTLNADGSITIDNLLRSTIAAATRELIAGGVDWTLSVFDDNSGVIAFDEHVGVCVKVETHNHPSAIEPYGGAATGIGGCIRDIIGTGLAARPIASTDVFCVAPPDAFATANPPGTEADAEGAPAALPSGCLHPRRILTDVVAGVRDYGNRMGIPTVNGAVAFDERFVGNPLVFCGCVGVIPRSGIRGEPRAGDRIVALGGRTGRDGIHGATFSSAGLTGTHADEFAHAVQIGNPIEQKRMLDAILRARDFVGEASGAGDQASGMEPRSAVPSSRCLFSAITDCGAGGFSSAIGEMGRMLGAEVHLDRAPLKYDGLTYAEIWISEAQERMVLAVPPACLDALRRICDEEGVEIADLGCFGTPGQELILRHEGHEVGRVSMGFLHGGLPTPTRQAVWTPAPRGWCGVATSSGAGTPPVRDLLLRVLAHPNVASKHWIVRQYDHEVQGGTLVKPLVGPLGAGPGDAAVIEPVPGTGRALAVGCGLGMSRPGGGGTSEDPYQVALCAIDECVRNLVCVGADASRIAILDNFCWPSCDEPRNLAALVRAAEGCYDGAKAYGTPFVSGKDSLNNQFTTGGGRVIEIPWTLLVSGIGIVSDASRCVTSDAKRAGNLLVLAGRTGPDMEGSICARACALAEAGWTFPGVDLHLGPRAARAVSRLAALGLISAAHDCSEGGLLTAVAEMLIGAASPGSALGARVDFSGVHADAVVAAFAESPSRYVLEVAPDDLAAVERELAEVPFAVIGELTDGGRLAVRARGAVMDEPVEALLRAWRAPLDW